MRKIENEHFNCVKMVSCKVTIANDDNRNLEVYGVGAIMGMTRGIGGVMGVLGLAGTVGTLGPEGV